MGDGLHATHSPSEPEHLGDEAANGGLAPS